MAKDNRNQNEAILNKITPKSLPKKENAMDKSQKVMEEILDWWQAAPIDKRDAINGTIESIEHDFPFNDLVMALATTKKTSYGKEVRDSLDRIK